MVQRVAVAALSIALCLALAGCSGRDATGSGTEAPAATSSKYDAVAAEKLWSAALTTLGRNTAGTIPESEWAPAVRELNPVRVYVHALNVVIVLRESQSQESGKYVVSGLSSSMLRQGSDGFTLTPDPELPSAAPRIEVYDYTRNK